MIRILKACVSAFIFIFIAAFLGRMGFRINMTPSLPKGIYQLIKTDPKKYKKGDLVIFDLPKDAKKRGRAQNGWGFRPFLKNVMGVPGDIIEIKKETVHINGIALKNGKILKQDRRGRELKSCGDITLSGNQFFVMALYNPKSYDSRYFGPIDKNMIKGKAEAIFTW